MSRAAFDRIRAEKEWVTIEGGHFGLLYVPSQELDVLCCPRCSGRLRLVALMSEPKEIGRYLRALGEPIEAPDRGPARGPPDSAPRALRRRAGDVDVDAA